MKRKTIEVGSKFNRLTVLSSGLIVDGRKYFANVQCSCGKTKIVHEHNLRRGITQSCGCLNKERLKIVRQRKANPANKLSGAGSWRAMMARCYNPNNNQYKNYGARGITVCERWHKIENFLADMGERPKGKTIERNDNNKNYELSNCRWATQKEQQSNKRNRRTLIFNGETLTTLEVERRLGICLHGVDRIMKKLKCSRQVAFERYLEHRKTNKHFITY